MAKYRNPFSIDHRKPVFIDSSDPRNKNLERYRSRLGRDISITEDLSEIKTLEKYTPPTNYWISYYQRNAVFRSCVVDSQKNVYSVGAIGNFASGSTDLAGLLVKYDKDRNIVWGKTLSSGTGGWTTTSDTSGGELYIYDVKSDSSSNIYVTGNYKSGSKYNTFVAKYNSSGILLFQRTINVQIDQMSSIFSRITIDSAKNIYVTTSSLSGTGNVLLFKYSSSGSLLWKKQINAPAGCFQAVIATDSNDNIIMCLLNKKMLPSGYGFDYVSNRFSFLKINNNGSLISEVCFENNYNAISFSATSQVLPLKLMCDSNDNVYLSALTWQNRGAHPEDHIQRPFLMKLNSSFTSIWQKAPADPGTQSWTSWAEGLSLDSQKNIYWGVYRGLNTAIIYKLDSSGNQIFANNIFLGTPYSDGSVYGVYLDKSNVLYMAGAGHYSTERQPYTFKIISDTSLLGSYPIPNPGSVFDPINFSYNSLSVSLKDITYYVTRTAELTITDSSITESAGSFLPFSLTYGETGRYIP